MDYKTGWSGCIAVSDQLVDWLNDNPPKARNAPRAFGIRIGGFAALFDARFPSYQHPLLVTSTDGVGTKLN